MSTIINNVNSEYNNQTQSADEQSNFNDLVLTYIKNNKPDGTLDQLLEKMKSFSPNEPATMKKLNAALLNADLMLRSTPEYEDYTMAVLDKNTCQIACINMLNNTLINKMIDVDEDDESKKLILY